MLERPEQSLSGFYHARTNLLGQNLGFRNPLGEHIQDLQFRWLKKQSVEVIIGKLWANYRKYRKFMGNMGKSKN